MPFMAHAFRAGEGAGSGWERPGARSGGTRQDLGLLLLAVLVALEKEQQGRDKAQFEKRSGLERQGRERDNGSAAGTGSAFPRWSRSLGAKRGSGSVCLLISTSSSCHSPPSC